MSTEKNNDEVYHDIMVGKMQVNRAKIDDPVSILMKMITSGQRLALHAKIQGIDLNDLRAEYGMAKNKGARMGQINESIGEAIKTAALKAAEASKD